MTRIKEMQLYPAPERIERSLAARGFGEFVPVEEVAKLDQLHYHGVDAVDVAIDRLAISAKDAVLEVGSGWGGPSRWIAHRTGARVVAVELQEDYDRIGRALTRRCQLADNISHVCGDFLEVPLNGGFNHIVSWLALYHIPDRPRYLGRIRDLLNPGGGLWIEDLALAKEIPSAVRPKFETDMFPNSIRRIEDYGPDLETAGFVDVQIEDMTDDWAEFVSNRLEAFKKTRTDYEAEQGTDGYQALLSFYEAVSGYFADGTLAGVRARAKKPT